MAEYNGKEWLRSNLTPYLSKIKSEINSVAAIVGNYTGAGTDFASLPSTDPDGSSLEAGDWSILQTDTIGTGDAANPQYPAGVYVYDPSATFWELVQENQDLGDVLTAINATPTEVDVGTATDKFANVSQLSLKYAKINGNIAEVFTVLPAQVDSDHALNANQFPSTAITNVEASADYDAA